MDNRNIKFLVNNTEIPFILSDTGIMIICWDYGIKQELHLYLSLQLEERLLLINVWVMHMVVSSIVQLMI